MKQFDNIFAQEGHGLPVSFLRALAKRESGMNPLQASGPAWGLLQVGIDKRAGNVLKEYNRRNGTEYTKEDMLNPRLNVRVATELLAKIVELLRAEGLAENWENGNWIGVVVAAWNAGYSKKGGVLKVIRYMKRKGLSITLSALYEQTPKSGAGRGFIKRMNQQKRRDWTRTVVASTLREQGIPPAVNVKDSAKWVPLLFALLALA